MKKFKNIKFIFYAIILITANFSKNLAMVNKPISENKNDNTDNTEEAFKSFNKLFETFKFTDTQDIKGNNLKLYSEAIKFIQYVMQEAVNQIFYNNEKLCVENEKYIECIKKITSAQIIIRNDKQPKIKHISENELDKIIDIIIKENINNITQNKENIKVILNEIANATENEIKNIINILSCRSNEPAGYIQNTIENRFFHMNLDNMKEQFAKTYYDYMYKIVDVIYDAATGIKLFIDHLEKIITSEKNITCSLTASIENLKTELSKTYEKSLKEQDEEDFTKICPYNNDNNTTYIEENINNESISDSNLCLTNINLWDELDKIVKNTKSQYECILEKIEKPDNETEKILWEKITELIKTIDKIYRAVENSDDKKREMLEILTASNGEILKNDKNFNKKILDNEHAIEILDKLSKNISKNVSENMTEEKQGEFCDILLKTKDLIGKIIIQHNKIKNDKFSEIIERFNNFLKYCKSIEYEKVPFTQISEIIKEITKNLNNEKYSEKFAELIEKIFIFYNIIKEDKEIPNKEQYEKIFNKEGKEMILKSIKQEIKDIKCEKEEITNMLLKLKESTMQNFPSKENGVDGVLKKYISKITLPENQDALLRRYKRVLKYYSENNLILFIRHYKENYRKISETEKDNIYENFQQLTKIEKELIQSIANFIKITKYELDISNKSIDLTQALNIYNEYSKRDYIFQKTKDLKDYLNVLGAFFRPSDKDIHKTYSKMNDFIKKSKIKIELDNDIPQQDIRMKDNKIKDTEKEKNIKDIIEENIKKLEFFIYSPSSNEYFSNSDKILIESILFKDTEHEIRTILNKEFKETEKMYPEISKEQLEKATHIYQEIIKNYDEEYMAKKHTKEDFLQFLNILETSSAHIEKSIDVQVYKPENLKIIVEILNKAEDLKNS